MRCSDVALQSLAKVLTMIVPALERAQMTVRYRENGESKMEVIKESLLKAGLKNTFEQR